MRHERTSLFSFLQEGILRFEFTLEEKAPAAGPRVELSTARVCKPRAGCSRRSLFWWFPADDPVGQGPRAPLGPRAL